MRGINVAPNIGFATPFVDNSQCLSWRKYPQPQSHSDGLSAPPTRRRRGACNRPRQPAVAWHHGRTRRVAARCIVFSNADTRRLPSASQARHDNEHIDVHDRAIERSQAEGFATGGTSANERATECCRFKEMLPPEQTCGHVPAASPGSVSRKL